MCLDVVCPDRAVPRAAVLDLLGRALYVAANVRVLLASYVTFGILDG